MKYIFLLSGDYADLAKEEIFSLLGVSGYNLTDRLLVADFKGDESLLIKSSKRLALTKSIYRMLFDCKLNELIEMMKKHDWGAVYKDSFCLRINNQAPSKKFVSCSEESLAGYIWNSVKNPKTNLKNPRTAVEIFIIKNKAYCGLLIYKNDEKFELRKSHLRPFSHPSSLHPKIARALVNISGIGENEILLDPFCGTGGFLIEAGLMKIKSIGCDINKIMVNGCRENLKNFKIRNYEIFNDNALKIPYRFDCIVTDLPYGLNSNALLKYKKQSWKKYRINLKIQKKDFLKNLENFYLLFLKKLRKKLKKKAVIIFPSYVNHKKLLKTAKFRIEKEFSIYVHRSLTRKIVKF